MRQDDEMNSEQMGEQGGSNWPKFEDADWPVGGEDKPSGWAFTTRRSGIHPNLKPPIGDGEASHKKRQVRLRCEFVGDASSVTNNMTTTRVVCT